MMCLDHLNLVDRYRRRDHICWTADQISKSPCWRSRGGCFTGAPYRDGIATRSTVRSGRRADDRHVRRTLREPRPHSNPFDRSRLRRGAPFVSIPPRRAGRAHSLEPSFVCLVFHAASLRPNRFASLLSFSISPRNTARRAPTRARAQGAGLAAEI
jgi:hypothetical protein